MDEPFTQALLIRPRRSRCLACFIFFVHLGAAGSVISCAIPAHFKFLAIIFICGTFMRSFRTWWLDCAGANSQQFILSAAGSWLSRDQEGQSVELELLSPAFVHPGLIVIRLRSTGDPRVRRDLILLPDNIDADTARRLRVRLRMPP